MAWLRSRPDGRQPAENNSPANDGEPAGRDAARDEIAPCNDKPPGDVDGSQGVELLERKAENASLGAPGVRAYKTYKRRWFGLVQLVLLNIVVSWDVRWPYSRTKKTHAR